MNQKNKDKQVPPWKQQPLEPEDMAYVPSAAEEGFEADTSEKDAHLAEIVGEDVRPRDRRAKLASLCNTFWQHYQHRDYRGHVTRYKPKTDSEAWRGLHQAGFFVTYSIPKGGDSVVASFWTQREDPEQPDSTMEIVHMDLTTLVESLLANSGYKPLPKKEDRTE